MKLIVFGGKGWILTYLKSKSTLALQPGPREIFGPLSLH